jgi:gluconate 5-dehydrogenase
MDAMARFSVAGRTALVTGASYGLGANFADYLAHAKANVVLAARSTDKLETVAKELEADGCSVLPLTCDVADPASVKHAFAAAFDHFGRVDILVNNAGVSAEAGVFPERVPDDLFAQTVSVNLNGLFTCCREVAARWLADGKAARSSMWRPWPDSAGSSTSRPPTRRRRPRSST